MVNTWFHHSDDQVFVLAGYAGTGKTTLANYFATDNTLFCSLTGKAASALKNRGVENAYTIHQLIYTPQSKSKRDLEDLQEKYKQAQSEDEQQRLSQLIVEEKRRLSKPSFMLKNDSPLNKSDLVVVDEYSMLNQYLLEDLKQFGCKILALGDPFQLPPVKDTTPLTPDFFLTEVFRNEGSILDAATKVRLGEELSLQDSGAMRVLHKSDTTFEDFDQVEQIIVARNKTRQQINKRMREKRNLTAKYPQQGERVIFLKNQHDQGIYNGTTVITTKDSEEYDDIVVIHTEEFGPVPVDSDCFQGKDFVFTDQGTQNADFGYAVTCHKAQGSEFDSVLVYDEGFGHNSEMRRRWLYTALTRAKNHCTVVKT